MNLLWRLYIRLFRFRGSLAQSNSSVSSPRGQAESSQEDTDRKRQLRLCVTLRYWINMHWNEFDAESPLTHRARDFGRISSCHSSCILFVLTHIFSSLLSVVLSDVVPRFLAVATSLTNLLNNPKKVKKKKPNQRKDIKFID